MRFHDLEAGMAKYEKLAAAGQLTEDQLTDADLWGHICRRVGHAAVFDMREATRAVTTDMIEFGHGLLAHGIFRLPYATTAFLLFGEIWVTHYHEATKTVEIILCQYLYTPEGEKTEYVMPSAILKFQIGEQVGELIYDFITIRDSVSVKNISGLDDPLSVAALSILGFTAVLAAKGVEMEMVDAPARLNKAREKKGKPPIRSRVVVKLGRHCGLGESSATHTPPKLHWRRGHFRTIYEGTEKQRVVPVVPCLVNASEGVYIPPPKEYRVVQ